MPNQKVNALLDDIRLICPERYPLVVELRTTILQLDMGVTEEVKYGGLLYSCGQAFCGIFSYSQHVSLEFGEGASLADKHQVLEGSGKLRRHIKLRVPDDMASKHVLAYLQTALQRAMCRILPR